MQLEMQFLYVMMHTVNQDPEEQKKAYKIIHSQYPDTIHLFS